MFKTLVDQWLKAKAEYSRWKEQELQLRNQIIPVILEDKQIGSKTTIFQGVKLRATARMNFTVDEDELKVIWQNLTEEERACIDYKPKVNETKYRKLPEDSLLHTAITVKPGQGGLNVV